MGLIEYTKEEGIGIITINRPETLNSIDSQLLDELSALLDEIKVQEETRVVIVTGKGKAFVAGGDIAAMQSMNSSEGYQFGCRGQEVYAKFEKLPQPVIAAVNGYALGGGCEMAMACDIRLASVKAKFGMPEVSLGIIPGFGGTQRLPRLVGKGKALELLMSGRPINAEEAERIGLVEKVVEGDVLDSAKELAKEILKKGPLAIRYIKSVVQYGLEVEKNAAIASEASLLGLCFASEDQKEGMQAFLEKRKAQFKGI